MLTLKAIQVKALLTFLILCQVFHPALAPQCAELDEVYPCDILTAGRVLMVAKLTAKNTFLFPYSPF